MADISRFRRERAKQLRSKTTEAEQALWRALKRIPVYGSHFRRQVPIGPYVADFACLKARLLIELDGGQHSQDDIIAKDEARTRWLEQEGYRVIRFWNAELTENMNGVLDTIYAALYGSPQSEALALPTPPRPDGRPSPSRGG
ncbi:endonuclease domain-containing protein [Microvirga zambiensis]|uniref:endonuclease domain-containing protein n=1 Tax=Microvirga zambiensis TaxID=1402137 RepID=UPI001FE3F7E1|nr:endonuclease domain-containing protein [Microvirga zambiensis]